MYHSRKLFKKLPVILLLLLFCQICLVYAQENPCDPTLKPLSKDPLRYEQYDNRCEGLYYQSSPPTLSLVSLTESFEEYSLKSQQELVIEWKVPKAQKVQLRAPGNQPRPLLPYGYDPRVRRNTLSLADRSIAKAFNFSPGHRPARLGALFP